MKSIKLIIILLNILFFTQNNAVIPIRYENNEVTFVFNIPNVDNNSANLEIIRDLSIKKPSIIYKKLELNKPLVVNQNEISPSNEKFEAYRLTFSINQKKFNSLGFITQDVFGKKITFSTKTASLSKCSDELENLLPDKLPNGLDALKMNICVNIDDPSKTEADKTSAANLNVKPQADKVKFVLNIPNVDNNNANLTITRDVSINKPSSIMKELAPNKILIIDKKEVEPNSQKAESYRLTFTINKKRFNSIGDLPKDLYGKKITFSINSSPTEKCTDIIPNLLAEDFQPNVCIKAEDDIQKE